MQQAAQLREAADAIAGLDEFIKPENHVSVSLNGNDEHDIDIHGTSPEVLESLPRKFDTETVQVDADGIMRYVSIKQGRFEVTWYRR